MTPEGKVKVAVKAVLSRHSAFWHCPVQNGMGDPSLDFVCCHKGRYFAVETKAAGKVLTRRQEVTAADINIAGGVVFVVDGDHGLTALEHWLTCN